jgi:Na+-translocating ferredoxin:NAD+ oxidoreductase subunit G
MRLISSIKPALLLALMALIAVTVISVIETNTRERVAHNQALYKSKQLRALLQDIDYTNEPWSNAITAELNGIGTITLYPVRNKSELLAVVIESGGSQGYVSTIALLVAISIDPDGNDRVIGVRATQHRETPGLGDKIDIQRSNWMTQFDGTSLTMPDSTLWKTQKDGGSFDQLTGATVTSRAVISGVLDTLSAFAKNRSTLLEALDQNAKN